MKKATKRLIIAALIIAISVTCAVSVAAADCTIKADALHELGLFKGTDNGYDLDTGCTRAQVSVMLIRLLGKEAEVTEGTYTHPFTDSVQWADKYIGYMYETGLTKGTSATTFMPDADCSAQMCTTFILRALGYTEEAGDFTYSQAENFAASLGLPVCNEEFLRDDMVLISYAALFQNIKGQDTLLLEKLMNEGAVDADKTAKYLNFYNAYENMNSVQPTEKNLRVKLTSKVDVIASDLTASTAQTYDYTIENDGEDLKIKIETVSESDYGTNTQTVYYADGWVYISSPDGNFKAYLGERGGESLLSEANTPLYEDTFYCVNSIVESKNSKGCEYIIVYDPDISPMKGSLEAFFDTEEYSSVTPTAIKSTVFVDNENYFRSAEVICSVICTPADGSDHVRASSTAKFEFIASGNEVKVVLPDDLESYVELESILENK